jgi:hypothetical protein
MRMRWFSAAVVALLAFQGLSPAQTSLPSTATTSAAGAAGSESTIALHATSTMNVASEMGGAFMSGSKCDADGNLYIRKYAADRPLLGPVVKIDHGGKRIALFDPAAFSQLALNRADAFSPASDGGMYQIAQSGIVKPRTYVLRFSSDGSPSSPTRLDADFEVYTFAAFAGGNFLVSGVRRDVQNKNDQGRNITAVFSADGRELAQLSFHAPRESVNAGAKKEGDDSVPMLDLADAEVGSDGNLYVMRNSSPVLVYVITPSGTIMQTLKIATLRSGLMSTAFHVSVNRLAFSFWNEAKQSQTVVVADAQTGRRIASYAAVDGLGPSFACYSANEGIFTFLKLGTGNALEVIRAEVQ